jgi:hypothetical protein
MLDMPPQSSKYSVRDANEVRVAWFWDALEPSSRWQWSRLLPL